MASRQERKQWSGPRGDGPGWICDTCGQRIKNAGEGWLEWLSRSDEGRRKIIARELHLVHHAMYSPFAKTEQDCYFNEEQEVAKDGSTSSGSHLENFLDDDGLTELLAILGDGFELQDKLLEVIMRLHIRNYEEARPNLERARSEGIIEPNMREGFHLQQELKTVIEHYQTEHE
jgi:hypothetical protein